MKVLGVADAARSSANQETLVVFVEVVNPTRRPITLSRLEYRLDAEAWFQADGEVPLFQAISPQSSTVVEVPLRMHRVLHRNSTNQADGSVSYSLEGRLFAMSQRIQRSWAIAVEGTLSPDAVADARGAPRVRVRIADGNP